MKVRLDVGPDAEADVLLIFIFFCFTKRGAALVGAPSPGMLIQYSFAIDEHLLDEEAARCLELAQRCAGIAHVDGHAVAPSQY